MKKILVLLGLLLVLSVPAYAKVWTTSEEGALCVSGEGNYRVWGAGDFYVSGAGMFRFASDAPVVVVDGDWNTMTKNNYVYYSGAGTLTLDDYEGEFSSGGGSGYLEVHGTGSVELKGSVRDMNVGCIWE